MSSAQAQYNEEYREELILQVVKQPYLLSDGVVVIQEGSRYYVPLMELADMFSFYVDADMGREYLEGWYLNEDNAFSVDARKMELIFGDEKRALTEDDLLLEDYGGGMGEFYLLMELVSEMWPIELDIEYSTLSLNVETDEGKSLPFELALEREERREILVSKRAVSQQTRTDLVKVENPYRLLSAPAIDIENNYSWDGDEKRLLGGTTFNGANDFLGFTLDYGGTWTYSEGDFKRPANIRMRFSREAYGDDTLGLGFRKFEGGDTRLRARDLIGNSVSGRGVVLSSEELERAQEFDEVTLEGTAIPGWEVEIYRNQALIEFGTVDSFGEYRFENVPLNFGNNLFRIVFYGPQGQIEERLEEYTIGSGLLKPGESQYDVALIDVDRPFFQLENDPTPSREGVALKSYAAQGINRNMTVFSSYTRLPTNPTDLEQYATLGSMFSVGPVIGQVEGYRQMNGGSAIDTRLATKMFGVRLKSSFAKYYDFESPDAGNGTGAKDIEFKFTATPAGIKTPLGRLGLDLDVEHVERVNDLVTTVVRVKETLGAAGLRVSNDTTSTFQDEEHVASSGSTTLTSTIRKWQLRGGANYTLHPAIELTAGNVDVRYRGTDNFTAAVNAQHNFITSVYGFGGQVGYDFGTFLGSLDVDWQRERGFRFGVRASTSLAPTGALGAYEMSSRKLTSASPVIGRVFLDKDNNGIFDGDDEPLEDVHLKYDGGYSEKASDADGYVTDAGLGKRGPAVIEIDTSSLFDPYFRPGVGGYEMIARKGSINYFDFPIIETGAIDGTVYRESNGREIPGMKLQLVDSNGEVFTTTETAYDGFYTFEFVPPGNYTVRADPEYNVNVPPESVSVASDDLFLYGIDLYLLDQTEEAEAEQAESGRVAQTYLAQTADVTGQSGPLSSNGEPAAVAGEPVQLAPAVSGPVVKDVRIGEYPGKVRLVMDLSGPVAFDAQSVEGGKAVELKLAGVEWDAMQHWRKAGSPVLKSFDVETLPDGGSLVYIRGRGGLSVGENGSLAPDGTAGHRIYIDLLAQ